MNELNGHSIDARNGVASSIDAFAALSEYRVSPDRSDLPAMPIDTAGAAALDAERTRLESEIAAAESRVVAARQRAAEASEALHAVVLASKRRLADLESEHERHITMIRDAAQAEVERIFDDARRRVGVPPTPPPTFLNGPHADAS